MWGKIAEKVVGLILLFLFVVCVVVSYKLGVKGSENAAVWVFLGGMMCAMFGAELLWGGVLE